MYLWLVFLHLLGLALFLLGHGVSIGCSFRMRRERDRAVIAALLDLSARANQFGTGGLVLLGIFGLAAAWNTNQLTAPWIVGSYVVVVIVIIAMGAIASGFYYPLRDALGGAKGATPIAEAELVERLDNRRPELLLLVGGIGLILLIWLMVLKPG